ncbi:hypothetical protein JCGZ_24191 [Jatropha curcas]|uniref:Uncharacterized protein n=1 Tax=Jatropha curcas TaxID=180498 RepID=A0A067JQR8_JATCU|nr:hypothetical protein JCGZ_24191 [Jatropha curcas]
MGSPSNEEMPTLAKLSKDEIVEANECEVGKARDTVENIKVSDVPSDINEGELLAIASRYDFASEYELVRPGSDMRANTPLDDDEFMMLYEESLHSGIQFPLFEPLKSFFN